MAKEHEDNDLPLRSPLNMSPAPIATDQDEADINTIENILRIVKEAKDKCSDTNALDLDDSAVPVTQQVYAYKFALNEVLLPLEALIESTIGDVRLQQAKERKS